MFRRLLARVTRPQQPDTSAWWREAHALALAPDQARVAALRSQMLDPQTAPDIAELQEEMVDGLERLLVLAGESTLPVVATQHRVIGNEVCHFIAPVSLIEQVDASGKLFATAERLVFAAGAVKQWPWHSIASLTREERDVVIDLRGRPGAARLRANTYGDAIVIVALAGRLRSNRS
jgi:hypothetical protein